MSQTVLKIISTNPRFVPEQNKRNNAAEFLSNIFNGVDIEIVETFDVEFVDQGANFQDVSCDYCGQLIDVDTWQEAMDKAFESKFDDLSFTTSCCNKVTTLNNLKYNWPAGFAKFIIVVSNIKMSLNDGHIKVLENILVTSVRMIWAHY